MANQQLFDEDEKERYGGQRPGNAEDHELDNLRHSISPAEDIGGRGLFNPSGDTGGKGGKAGGLAKTTEGSSGGGSLFNASGDDQGGKIRNISKKIKGLAKKKFMLIAAGGGAIIIILFIVLIVLVGSLKLPDVAQGIESYEFAESAIEFSHSAQTVTDEELAIEGTNDGVFSQLKQKYGNLRDSTWGRLDKFRPNKVAQKLTQQLVDNNGLEIRVKQTAFRTTFVGGSINGNDYNVEPVTGLAKWTPGVRNIIEFKNQVAFNRSGFWQDVNSAMDDNKIGPVIRGLPFLNILRESGGTLVGWPLKDFAGKTGNDADVAATEVMYKATDNPANPPPPAASTEEIAEAEQAAQETTVKDATDDKQVESDIKNLGDDAPSLVAADGKLNSALVTDVLPAIDIVYGVVTPICIIFDGSVQQSGPTIDYQMHQQQNAADQLLAEADQQKKGDESAGNEGEFESAVQGTNDEIGDVSNSNAYQRTYGTPQSTADLPSAEAGSGGSYDYSLLNAIGYPADSIVGKSANFLAEHTCKLLTNTATAIALGIANLAVAIATFGGSEAGAEAAGEGARVFIQKFVEHIITEDVAKVGAEQGAKVVEKTLARQALNRGMRFAFKQGIIAGATYGLSEAAHLLVAARAGQTNNGLAQGNDLLNEADCGAGINNAEINRQLLFGRAETESEVAGQEQSSIGALAANNASQGFTQRYFALSNPDSLLTHVGMDLGADAHPGVLASTASLASNILRPMNSLGTLVSAMDGAAVAAPAPNDLDCGNVQFGWPSSEENLIASSDTYTPLANQAILDASGNEDAIAQEYAPCFGYAYNSGGNGDLDPSEDGSNMQVDPSGSLGTLLANEDIWRDDNGNVIANKGLCSPDNLSFNSPDSLAADSGDSDGPSPQANDMVFRWRLAMRYDGTIDQLTNEGDATTTSD